MLVSLMVGLIIYFNYFHSLEYKIVHSGNSWLSSFAGYYFIYFIPFAIAYFLQSFFYKDLSHFKKHSFWIILFLAPAIFSFRVNFTFLRPYIIQLWDADEQLFWLRCSKWFVGLFAALIPVYIIWKIKDSKTEPFYGSKKIAAYRPYLLLIVCMIPLITLAATQPDFLNMYPRAKIVAGWQLQPKNLFYILHEIFYSLDFITIEIFFRGFLIIGMIQLCGRHCIVPAACFYCCIHLGKPMGEAISSFAGGMLLGIISYNTKSIRGGLMVHLGIAWMMELAGFIAHYVQNSW
ncbi:MAG: CPBP family glutamic-type intramembrane protease [Ferruginibacter sp.]